jgi:glucosamine--fructose-6-phosphate aminotransferase (isomerizing)
MTVPTWFEREIREQPDVLERQLRDGRADVDAAATAIVAASPHAVMIAARGTSDNAARFAQYVLGAHNRLPVALAAPSLFTHYASPPRVAGALVIGISQSGQTPDIVAVVEEARRQGALTLAITNDAGSPLARAAAHVIALHAGPERAVAATKTYTSQLMAIAMLSAALERGDLRPEDPARWSELAAVPEHVAGALALGAPAAAAAARCDGATRFVVLGRGFNYATAFEIALKIEETSYVIAEPYSTADFRHGPAAMLEVGFPIVLVAPRGKLADVGAVLDLLEARRAEVIAISNDAEVLRRAPTALAIPDVPEWLSPLVAVVAGQWLALALAIARGADPDRPRGLSKVTHTR